MESSPYSFRILMKLVSSRKIFERFLNIKYNENPSSGSRIVPWEVTKLEGAFRNVTNSPKHAKHSGDQTHG